MWKKRIKKFKKIKKIKLKKCRCRAPPPAGPGTGWPPAENSNTDFAPWKKKGK